MSSLKDLTGQQFGRLTVLNRTEIKRDLRGRSIVYYKCQCSCGKTIETRGAALRFNHTNSCGCIQKEFVYKLGKSNYKGFEETGINYIFTRYKRGAKDRNLSFSLTRDVFKNLLNQNCYYCNEPPSNEFKRPDTPTHGFWNGIDRVNNYLGYEEKNVVTCCHICNVLKMDLDLKTFYDKVKKIYERHLNEKS